MIYVTRPVNETHKMVPKTEERSLFNNYNEKSSRQEQYDENVEKVEQERNYTREYLEKAIAETNEAIFGKDDHFEFQIHEGTGRTIVRLVDNETDEVIKEIPPEKILDLVASIWELVGILVDERG